MLATRSPDNGGMPITREDEKNEEQYKKIIFMSRYNR